MNARAAFQLPDSEACGTRNKARPQRLQESKRASQDAYAMVPTSESLISAPASMSPARGSSAPLRLNECFVCLEQLGRHHLTRPPLRQSSKPSIVYVHACPTPDDRLQSTTALPGIPPEAQATPFVVARPCDLSEASRGRKDKDRDLCHSTQLSGYAKRQGRLDSRVGFRRTGGVADPTRFG